MENKEPKEVITNRTTEAIQKAGISKETRELLTVKAMFIDAAESFYSWLDKYYAIDDNIINDISNSSMKVHSIIDDYLIAAILANMGYNNFKDI